MITRQLAEACDTCGIVRDVHGAYSNCIEGKKIVQRGGVRIMCVS
jgi:hypothetical protein